LTAFIALLQLDVFRFTFRLSNLEKTIMQLSIAVAMALHVLTTIFWAGSTAVMARMDGLDARKLFGPQVGAAVLAILSGGYLWHLFHSNTPGRAEHILMIGMGAALLALALQVIAFFKMRAANTSGRINSLHRPAAGLLAIAAVCMAAFRFL
jgi:hypothetical protein